MAIRFKTIKIGYEGQQVKDYQKLLQKAGSTIKVTGQYGIGMMSAVKSFQKKNNLPVTGEIDRKTSDKLKTYEKKKTMKK